MLNEVRCTCNRLLGKLHGEYEIKCPRCKSIIVGNTLTDKQKSYDKVKGE